MELAHPLDDGLARLVVGRNAERGILGSQAVERDAHLFLVGLGLRLHRQLDHGLGEFHPLQDDRVGRVAQRVAGRGLLEARDGDDVAGARFLDVLTRVRVHQEHTADLFLLVLHRVQVAALGQRARIDAGEGERADERIVHDLEGQCRERRIVFRRTRVRGLAVELHALHVGNVERRRQIVDHRVEQRLNALVLERRAAKDRNERHLERALADQLLEVGDRRLVALEIRFHQRIVLLDGHLDQVAAILRSLFLQIVGDVAIFELRAQALVEPDDRAVLDQVDQALEAAFLADREIQHGRTRAETLDDRVHAVIEVRAGAIELVDEAHPRNLVLVRLAPHGLRLRLHAGNAVEAGNRTVEHAQRTLDFDREVDVPGGVDDVDQVLFALALFSAPLAGGRRRGDRDPALLLLLHPVHRRGAFVHFADLIGLAGVIEDAFGRGRLAGVDVRHDADIAIALERMAAGHDRSSLAMWGAGVTGSPSYRSVVLPAEDRRTRCYQR